MGVKHEVELYIGKKLSFIPSPVNAEVWLFSIELYY